MKSFNPYLPLDEYIPDGEPHLFNGRVYIFGSHDKEGGYTYCMEDYVTYSADPLNLQEWKFEGVIYKSSQDPQYPNLKYMYAPDVVEGNDHRFYLYYSMAKEYGEGGYCGPISVAVANSPSGPYEFLGFVKYKDGTLMENYIPFDPAVFNDDGIIRLYYGTQYGFEEEKDYLTNPKYLDMECKMFGKTKEEILSYADSIMGPIMLTLEDDMVTVSTKPHHIIPCHVKGTSFEEHPFFEAASMRKIHNKYYFIYSSWQNHELCYATSDYPDKDFVFGGTIISNGDIGYQGRKTIDKLNMTGTTHGSILSIGDVHYVFYHRLTHKSDYSRQAMVERIQIVDGAIPQVECTSLGFCPNPLETDGEYPSVIACNITNGAMPHGSNSIYKEEFPNVNHLKDERFIAEIEHGTLLGYKYFHFVGQQRLQVEIRLEKGNTCLYEGPLRLDERCFDRGKKKTGYCENPPSDECYFEVRHAIEAKEVGRIYLNPSQTWNIFEGNINFWEGDYPLYFIYHGKVKIQFKSFKFIANKN